IEGADRDLRRLNEAMQRGRMDENVEYPSEKRLPGGIPQFDLAVAAGPWVEVFDVGQLRDQRQIDDGLFRIRISGDSMLPTFGDGDVVEFRCVRDFPHGLKIGRAYYIQRDTQATFKRLARVGRSAL